MRKTRQEVVIIIVNREGSLFVCSFVCFFFFT